MKNQKRWAMFLSIIPGAGHMYLGLQRMGIELMGLFFLTFYLSAELNMSLLGFFIPLIWFYTIFDVRIKAMAFMESPVEDRDIGFVTWIKTGTMRNESGWKPAGWLLILIGGLSLLDQVVLPVLDVQLSWQIRHVLQTSLPPFIFIVLGVKMILGSRKMIITTKSEGVPCESGE